MEKQLTNKVDRKDDVRTSNDLIDWLSSNDRLKKEQFVYHYTRLSSICKIIAGKTWRLSNPCDMNDKYEYRKFPDLSWKKIFYASFMLSSEESIAMWSMYAQPWEDGVMVQIPMKEFKKWVKSVDEIKLTYIRNDEVDKILILNKNQFVCSKALVGYTNVDRCPEGQTPMIKFSARGQIMGFADVYQRDILTGYIKDMAWDYEREIRFRIDTTEGYETLDKNDRIVIDVPVPESLIDSMTIYAGPRFDGSLKERIFHEITYTLPGDYKESKFSNYLAWVACDTCEKKCPKKETVCEVSMLAK